jgi:acetyl esterase/lipase
MPNSPPSPPISMRSVSSLSRRALLATGAAASAAALAGCTSLDALNGLNAVTPGDGDTEQSGQDIFFGQDERQALDIYGPKDAPTSLPVIVFFYGGNWASGQRQDYGFAARALAARGFVVVVPDYRLVPAYGFPAFVEDGAAAVRWTMANIARYGGDPARLSVMGHSAGAHIALMITLDPQWLGAENPITAAVGIAGPYDFLPFEPGGVADIAFGHVLDLATTQPITFAGPAKPPVLLLQGEDDDTVYPRNARNLAAALTKAGSSAKTIIYPDLGHIGILLALSKPFRGKAPVLEDATDFLLKPENR